MNNITNNPIPTCPWGQHYLFSESSILARTAKHRPFEHRADSQSSVSRGFPSVSHLAYCFQSIFKRLVAFLLLEQHCPLPAHPIQSDDQCTIIGNSSCRIYYVEPLVSALSDLDLFQSMIASCSPRTFANRRCSHQVRVAIYTHTSGTMTIL